MFGVGVGVGIGVGVGVGVDVKIEDFLSRLGIGVESETVWDRVCGLLLFWRCFFCDRL